MVEEVKVNFYRVHRCGYYGRSESTPRFGGMKDTFAELQDWAFDGTKPLSETCTYEPDDDSGLLHTYCFDLRNGSNGDILATTWNETETLDGAMASVNGADPAGHAAVNTTTIPAGHIPGYPTYFWFIPGKNVFATLRFGTRANGHQGLKLLLSDFLAKFTSHAVYEAEEDVGEEQLIGYMSGVGGEVQNLRPVFRSSPARLPGRIEYLRNNRDRITKLIRKSILSPQQQDDRNLWQKMLENLGITDSPQLVGDVKIRTELPHQPSESQLEQIIADWELGVSSSWDNVGFDLRGDDDVVWLSHALVKTRLELDVSRDPNGIVSLSSIENAITARRAHLIEMLP